MAIDFPASPTDGQIYSDPNNNRQYIYSLPLQRWSNHGGSSQTSLVKPLDPTNGETYFDPVNDTMEVYNSSSLTWEPVSAAVNNQVADYLFNDVALLLRGDSLSTNLAPGGFAFSPYSLTVSTSITKWGNGSLLFNGSSSYLGLSNDVISLSSDFTFEAWVYPLSRPSSGTTEGFMFLGSASSNDWRFQLDHNANGTVSAYCQGTTTSNNAVGTTVIPLNAWTHIAATHSNNAIYVFVNGIMEDMQEDVGINFAELTSVNRGTLWIGQNRNGGTLRRIHSHMEDIRFTNHARYTGAYTVPTTAHPTIALTASNPPSATPTIEGLILGLTSDDGTKNTYLGHTTEGPASGVNNTYIGVEAGNAMTSGNNNTFLGSGAGEQMPSGTNNTIVGRWSSSAPMSNHLVLSDGGRIIRSAFNSSGAMSVGNSLTNVGTSGQVLTSQGSNSPPYWSSPSSWVEAYTPLSGNQGAFVGFGGLPSSVTEIWFEYSGLGEFYNSNDLILRGSSSGTIQAGSIYHWNSHGNQDASMFSSGLSGTATGITIYQPWDSSSFAKVGRFHFKRYPNTSYWTVHGSASYGNYYSNVSLISGSMLLPGNLDGVYVGRPGSLVTTRPNILSSLSAFIHVWYR